MKEVLTMTKYREILRLSSLGFSNRNIALSVPCSRNTVSKVLKRAKELNLSWPLSDNQASDGLICCVVLDITTALILHLSDHLIMARKDLTP